MRRRALSTIFYLLLFAGLSAQHYRVLHWGIEDGLSQGINQKIIRDAAGFLWITSYEGLNRFDGKTFRNFYNFPHKRSSIKGVEITGLVVDSAQKIWFGSGDGLNRYDPVTDSVINFMPDKPPAGQSDYLIPIVATADEIICFDINGTVSGYHYKSLHRRIIASNIPWHTNYPSVNNSWLDKKKNSLWMPASTGIAQINIRTGEAVYFLQNEKVNAILHDQATGNIFIGSDNGVLLYNITHHVISPVDKLSAVLTGKVNCLSMDDAGALWIGTEEHGLFVINPDKKITQLIKTGATPNSINGNKINSIYCDAGAIVWAGIATNGIDQLLPGNGFTHYSENAGSPGSLSNNIVRCFMEDNEKNIWVATQGGGINIFNPVSQQFSSLTTKNLAGLPFNAVRYMVRDEYRTAWIGTEKGMSRVDMEKKLAKPIYFTGNNGLLADPYIEQIVPFENNDWLIATKEFGLFRLGRNADSARQLSIPGNKHVFYASYINQTLFLSVWDDKPRLFYIQHNKWTEFNKPIADFIITYVLYDAVNKKYWIGTLQGLLETDESLNILQHYTMDNGLSNNYIYAIVSDKLGFLWLSTNKGLSRFDTKTRSFRIFTPADGLQGYEYNAKAGFADTRENLYFGGTNGFDVINGAAVVSDAIPANFYIKELLINNIAYTGDRDINYTARLSVPYTSNNITIQTGVIDFVTLGNTKIKYQLAGIDTGWKYADRDFSINYSGLPPGTYTFTATAAGNNNTWNNKHTSFTISIAAPWWRNWWLRAAFLLLALGVLLALIRSFYSRKLEKQRQLLEKQTAVEQERTRIATDMHDDLGSALSRIKFLSETVCMQEQRQEPVTNEINKIKMYSDEMIDKMGEIVWALNEKNDSLHHLIAYTRSYAVGHFSLHGLDCSVNFPEEVPEIFVSGEFRRNVFLAIKETLQNITKHSGATEVRLSLAVTDSLFVEIKDNGIGFDPDTVRPYSNGLTNIKTRMQNIGGVAVIKAYQGVEVRLVVPLSQ